MEVCLSMWKYGFETSRFSLDFPHVRSKRKGSWPFWIHLALPQVLAAFNKEVEQVPDPRMVMESRLDTQ